ncbi:MAG: hypothetical protein HOK66_10320, partial [Marinovum sp.]|nr:hypothetical protein [Marinovum sp.]
ILPKGGPLGYGLALIAELVGEAMLGPVPKGEINWLVLALNCHNYNEAPMMQAAAEEVLSEIRASTPASDHEQVLIPGERERDALAKSTHGPLTVPRRIWTAIQTMEQDFAPPK